MEMEKVTRALDEMEFKGKTSSHFFIQTAAEWASYVVVANTGEALDAGLEISKAMVKYAQAIGIE